jgi:hypothetical protein
LKTEGEPLARCLLVGHDRWQIDSDSRDGGPSRGELKEAVPVALGMAALTGISPTVTRWTM